MTKKYSRKPSHSFGRSRPDAAKSFSLHGKPVRNTHFRELPKPTGHAPFIRNVKGQDMVTPVLLEDKEGDSVTLERYSDDHHGFLWLKVTDKVVKGRYYMVPRPQEPNSKGNKLHDYFEFDWKKRRTVVNNL